MIPLQQSSVFSRLGEKSQVSSTSNQDVLEQKTYFEDIPVSRESALPYVGVFKPEPQKKTMKKVHIQKSKKSLKKEGCLIHKIVWRGKNEFLFIDTHLKDSNTKSKFVCDAGLSFTSLCS